MPEENLHRRESDARIDRIDSRLEYIAERLEQVAVLVVQEAQHERRLQRIEAQIDALNKADAVQTSKLGIGERVLWAILTAAVGTAGIAGREFLSPPSQD